MSTLRSIALVSIIASSLVTSTGRADTVSGTGKGIVGGALLGGEVVSLGLGIARVRSGWPYLIGAPIGIAGGAVGGWALEESGPDPEVPMYLLAGGMALLLPALIVSLDAVSTYVPPDEEAETAHPAVDISSKSVAFSVPSVSVSRLYTKAEQSKYGVAAGHEVQIPVVGANF